MSTAVPAASPSSTAAVHTASELVDNIGQTPLLRLDRVTADLPDTVAVYAKAEHLNPGGSVKDRPALRMIEDGLDSGAFRRDQTLIDATSGNTGIAYAMIGAAKGLDVTLVASISVWSRRNVPAPRPSSIIRRAGRSFTEPPGFRCSALA